MAGGTGDTQSRPSMAAPMAFIKSTCSCVDVVVRGIWGCLAYHLGFCEDSAHDRSKKEDHHEEEEEEEVTKTKKEEEHEEGEDDTKTRKREEHEEEEEDQTRTRNIEEDDETKPKANGGSTENFGVMLTRGPRRPGISQGGGGQVN